MSPVLQRIPRASLGPLPEDATSWLRQLGGPTAIHAPGRDRSRTRVVTTLLHGNEASGAYAIHAWLRGEAPPAVDTVFVVANVEAALHAPVYTWRTAPGHRDLNRCFLGPFDDPDDADGLLARAILDEIEAAAPEAVVDLHNNSGHNPPYGVGLFATTEVLHIVSLFADRFVVSRMTLGALIEALPGACATIEVGRGGDPAADAVALAGLGRFVEREDVLGGVGEPVVQVLEMPMRAELRAGVRLAVGEAAEPGADFTLHADLDRHNFERVPPGTALGWCREARSPLCLRDEGGEDRSADYFAVEAGQLWTRRELIPIMITTNPKIAASDCLFYVVRESG